MSSDMQNRLWFTYLIPQLLDRDLIIIPCFVPNKIKYFFSKKEGDILLFAPPSEGVGAGQGPQKALNGQSPNQPSPLISSLADQTPDT